MTSAAAALWALAALVWWAWIHARRTARGAPSGFDLVGRRERRAVAALTPMLIAGVAVAAFASLDGRHDEVRLALSFVFLLALASTAVLAIALLAFGWPRALVPAHLRDLHAPDRPAPAETPPERSRRVRRGVALRAALSAGCLVLGAWALADWSSYNDVFERRSEVLAALLLPSAVALAVAARAVGRESAEPVRSPPATESARGAPPHERLRRRAERRRKKRAARRRRA